MSQRLHVALLWHMHQPPYDDPITGEVLLPWVRLHATKDYYDMAAAVQNHPKMRCTFNFVPSLLDQLEDATSESYHDRFTDFTDPLPTQLSQTQRHLAVKELFSAHPPTMIHPFPRYRELWLRKETAPNQHDFSTLFSSQELTDLQVWFELAWCGPTLRNYPEIAALVTKGAQFDTQDKLLLRDKQKKVCADIIPLLRSLSSSGQIELSTSPYYHPILPLLDDSNAAKSSNSNVKLPKLRFAYPVDARNHVQRAIRSHSRRFSSSPLGVWPSEGSVSDAVLAMLARQNVKWVASDEGILWKSLPGNEPSLDLLCRPWLSNGIVLFFRHRSLSDRIGFTYSQWEPHTAVRDFVDRLHEIRRKSAIIDPIVTIALDGENAWEYFPDGAVGFIHGLYAALSNDPQLVPTTFSDYLRGRATKSYGQLPHVAPGSWIDGNFNTWIGDKFKNAGWDLLTTVREKFADVCAGLNGPLPPHLQEAYRLILRAEASDWFWWLGDGHESAHDADFDRLFRNTITQIYKLLKLPIPDELSWPIDPKTTGRSQQQAHGISSPSLDGRTTRFYDWRKSLTFTEQQGAIHHHNDTISSVRVGISYNSLFLRIIGKSMAEAWFRAPTNSVSVVFVSPKSCTLVVHESNLCDVRSASLLSIAAPSEVSKTAPLSYGVRYIADETLDIEVPWATLNSNHAVAAFQLKFYIECFDQNVITTRFPATGQLSLFVNVEEIASADWLV